MLISYFGRAVRFILLSRGSLVARLSGGARSGAAGRTLSRALWAIPSVEQHDPGASVDSAAGSSRELPVHVGDAGSASGQYATPHPAQRTCRELAAVVSRNCSGVGWGDRLGAYGHCRAFHAQLTAEVERDGARPRPARTALAANTPACFSGRPTPGLKPRKNGPGGGFTPWHLRIPPRAPSCDCRLHQFGGRCPPLTLFSSPALRRQESAAYKLGCNSQHQFGWTGGRYHLGTARPGAQQMPIRHYCQRWRSRDPRTAAV